MLGSDEYKAALQVIRLSALLSDTHRTRWSTERRLMVKPDFYKAFRCTHLSGALVQIDVGVGQVMGVNKDDSIFTRYGSSWTQLPGKLKHVTVGPAGVWGANRENHIFKLVGTDWLNVPGLLKQIDAGGDQFVAGANHVDAPFCLPKENTVGYSGSNSALNWRQIPGSLKYYSCGPYSCWGVNSGDQIFVRKGVNSFNCEGDGTWQKVPGSLSMIEVGSDGSVYGVNSAGGVFRRDSTSACQPEGTGWTHLPLYSGQVKHVSYDLGHLWLILNNDAIYDCTEL
ncbi:fish-egg lectin-like isoform X1 [Hypomesus transpacificus]|uniref:fish-egg lectin-like isoform X1 n=2 Tax=Hypomesus transpacificus TaxID=137520 RepID=UPI001F074172|nr:fish-egg lectin-like isoform X1 [Hypomesus transpacificus]